MMSFFSEYEFKVPGNEIPNWFNHQSVGSSISFWIGPEFPTFALCLAFGKEDACLILMYHVDISINGRKRKFQRTLFGELSLTICGFTVESGLIAEAISGLESR
jgi:hypothetical protein